jgi:anti-sigma B factor antagonist
MPRIRAMPSEELVIENSNTNGIGIIRLTGPLTIGGVFKFQNAFRAESAPVVIIDMSAVPYADSAGIGSLVLAHVSCQKAGRKLALAGVTDRPQEVMRVTRVNQLFTTFPSVAEAEQKLSAA